MSSPRGKTLAGLINRLLDLPVPEGWHEDFAGHLEIMGAALDADAFALVEINPDTAEARVVAGAGLRMSGDMLPIPLTAPVFTSRAVEAAGRPALALEGPFPEDAFLQGEDARRILLRTTCAEKLCLTTAAIGRKGTSFTRNEAARFGAVAGVFNLIAVSARHREELRTGAGVDSLTGLGLYTYFHDSMVEEISRARRSGGTVTMGVMSIVPAGSETAENALAKVARAFLDQLRNFDTLARYGAEELAFILPELKSAEGLRVLERVIREVVSSLGGDGRAPLIYAGMSCYPEDGATVERLIEMAEAAMNRAVDETRPGVFRWETEPGPGG